MLNTLNKLQLLDVVALKESIPEQNLQSGQVGTIVELLAPDVYEIDFSDNNGQTYAMLPLHTSQLLKLTYFPNPSEIHLEPSTMSTSIHQYGLGDNVGGDKVIGDKNVIRITHNQQITTELLELVASLRQSVAQFPQPIQDDILLDIEDIEAELKTPAAQRSLPKLKKRLLALVAATGLAAAPIAAVTDFTNNITDIGSKLGIEIHLPTGS